MEMTRGVLGEFQYVTTWKRLEENQLQIRI